MANAWTDQKPGGTSAGSLADLYDTLLARTPYVLDPAEDFEALDMANSVLVILSGQFFVLDPADLVSAHDGVAVLVDVTGRRYKLVGDLDGGAVQDILADPPATPNLGQSWIVAAAATGAWAGQDDSVATWTAEGWRFALPRVSMVRYSIAALGFYHYGAAGAWLAGFGGFSVPQAGITPVELQFPAGLSVEGEINAPPGSPVNGDAWLVGTAPSGEFAGEAGRLAIRRADAWIFLALAEGAELYDKAGGRKLFLRGGVWAPETSFQALELIYEYDFTGNSAQLLDIVGLDAYVELMLVGIDLDRDIGLKVSSDDGSTFDTVAVNYDGSPADYFEVYENSRLAAHLVGFNKAKPTGNLGGIGAGQVHRPETALNAIRLDAYATTFNINAGKVYLYGVRG